MRASSSSSSSGAADTLRLVPGNLNHFFKWEQKKLDEGSFGSVYRGELLQDMDRWKKGKVVAIKIMHPRAVALNMRAIHHVREPRGGDPRCGSTLHPLAEM